MRKTITQKTLDHLPPVTGKRIEIRDTLVPGFMLRLSKAGSQAWYVATRVNGRGKRIKIGTYPILSLTDAREKARELLRDKQLGRLSPVGNAMTTKRCASLQDIIPQFIELYAKPRNRDWKETQALLSKFNVLGNMPITEIKRRDIIPVLDSIIARGTPYRANRALAAIRKLFSWCVNRGLLELNCLSGMERPAREIPRDRVLTEKELVGCWQMAEADKFPFGHFLKLLMLTGQRRGEVSGILRPLTINSIW